MKSKTILTTLITIICLLTPNRLIAQSSDIDLEVAPGVVFLTIKPGQKKIHTITLEQKGKIPLFVTPTLVDFQADGETGNPILSNSSEVDFISINNKSIELDQPFTLAPGDSQQILLNINPPGDLAEQEYPLSLLFKAEPTNNNSTGNGALSSAIIGSNLILHITPNETNNGKLEVEKIKSSRIFDSFRPINFQILIKNTGDNATPIDGKVKLMSWQGKELKSFTLVPDMVLGNSTRLARYSISDNSEEELDDLSDKFTYSAPFLIGPYTIEVSLNDTQKDIEQSYLLQSHLLAFPISILLLIFFVINSYLAYRYLVAKD